MGTALRNPGHIIALLCLSAAVLDGAVLVQGAQDDSVALPAGADTNVPIIGLARQPPGTSLNAPVDVVTSGAYPAIASAAIARGDLVTVANAAGKVKALGLTSGAGATVLGMALESAAGDGSRVAILLLPHAGASLVRPFVAGTGGVTAGAIVVVDTTTDNQVVLPAGADPTKAVVGVALADAAAGAVARIVVRGPALVKAGANITRGEHVAVHAATGAGKNAAPAAGANSMCVGTALASITSPALGLVIVNPYVFQG